MIANYGSGSPQEAADWVRYANVTKNHGVKHWKIGNEVFGNGHYAANWELDCHDSKSATTYASLVVQYATPMKAVDPAVDVLQQTRSLPGELAQLRQKIDHYAGPNAANIGIAVTETASNYQSDTQVGGLFTADVSLTALENGVFNVDCWDTRNGMPDGAERATTAPSKPGRSSATPQTP